MISAVSLPAEVDEEISLREHASNLGRLLVLSTLMAETRSEERIIHLILTSVATFADCNVVGLFVARSGWAFAPGLSEATRRDVQALLRSSEGGVPVGVPGANWAFAFPIGSSTGCAGHLILSGDVEPTADERFLLSSLAKHAGSALAGASLQRRLGKSLEIHEQLTGAAIEGQGQQHLAETLSRLTGMPVAIEDASGKMRAYAGDDIPDPYPTDPQPARERLLRRLREAAGQPVADGGRLYALAAPVPAATLLIALGGPPHRLGEFETIALRHAATALALEVARLRSLAESELRHRRDLVEELLSGTDSKSAIRRAAILGSNLKVPHRVVIVRGHGPAEDGDQLLHAVRTVATNLGMGGLVVARSGTVVLLAEGEPGWDNMRRNILNELGGEGCRVGVGGRCVTPSEFPRSHKEAQLALDLQGADTVVPFDDLGVYRIFSEPQNIRATKEFVDQQLGPLLKYDGKRKSSHLVLTLHQYLECWGNLELTSNVLAIHRSTLRYRLERIQALIDRDLRCPDARFNLHLATRVWRTMSAPEDQLSEL